MPKEQLECHALWWVRVQRKGGVPILEHCCPRHQHCRPGVPPRGGGVSHVRVVCRHPAKLP